jgi:hypothetical protein
VARYSEWTETTSSSSRARTASTDLPSRSARRSRGEDLEAGDAHFQVGQAEELGEGVGEIDAEGGSYRLRKRFLRPEVHAEGGQLSPRQHHAMRGVHSFQLTDFHPFEDVRQRHAEDLGRIQMTNDTPRKKIVIIAGPNGAGKTTFATEFLPYEGGHPVFVNADLTAAGLSPFNPEAAAFRARRLMLEVVNEFLQDVERLTLRERWR